MTRRSVVLALVGAALVAAVGAFALAARGGGAAGPATTPWAERVFSASGWATLKRRLASEGLRPETAQLVADGGRVSLVAAFGRSGRPCFVVVRGGHVEAPLCRVTRPLTVVAVRDGALTDLVGIVRRDVPGVVAHQASGASSLTLLPAPGAFAIGGSFRRPVALTTAP